MAICASIILGATVLAYRPQEVKASEFRFPSGIPSSLGTVSLTTVGDQQYKTITISGAGTSSNKANQATVTLGVQTEDPSAAAAAEENARLMTAVIAAIKEQGITEDMIETISYNIYPIYDSTTYQRIIAYRVVNTVNVKITDLDKIGDVIDAASKSGANSIEGVSFGLTDELANQLKLDAYRKALSDASTKANVIAETLGIKITGVLSVSESVYYPYTPYRGYAAAEVSGKVSTPVFQGSLSVSVNVQIVYAFE